MKTINKYITEKLVIGNNLDKGYIYFPKDINELIEYIREKIDKEGLGTEDKPLDLNDIDTSKIEDMSYLFDIDDGQLWDLSKNGHFNISNWDVSNVKYMEYMFYKSSFNGDISKWDVSNVKNMECMFYCSTFNGDISDWNVREVKSMNYMFIKCPLEKNPPRWYKN